ncbi:uncharacterized protein [Pyxicephalus adspersus]|uniref:uncharacterized protein isoform X2 n=1 Tax=Pyxicephalus adspersus TaxID=30357 RepID=UPI003B5ACD90
MEKEQTDMTRRILNLTLEIIYLLIGEECIIVKKPTDDHENWSSKSSPMMENPTSSSISEINNDKKILEIIQKIIELMTGEVPTKWHDVSLTFCKEERNKNLYKEVITEKQLPLTLSDRSSNRNTSERRPCHLYSQDSIQEDQEIPGDDQGDGLIVKTEDVIEQYMRYTRGNELYKGEEITPEITTDPGHTRDTQRDVKVEEEEDEEGHVRNKEEEIPLEISTDPETDIKAEEEDERHVRIKEEEIPFEIGTECCGFSKGKEQCVD